MYFLSWQMSLGWNHELTRTLLVDKVGELFKELEMEYPEHHPTVVPNPYEYNIIDTNGDHVPHDNPFIKKARGSNAWSVSGKHTESGNAMLCNDPHLPLSTPAFFMEMHLETKGGIAVTGASFPGVPAIMIGHNQYIAWGITLSFSDVEDIVLEKFDKEKPTFYHYEDELLPATIINTEVKVKGEDQPRIAQLIYTRNGPIISNSLGYSNTVSLRSTILNCTLPSVFPQTGMLYSNDWKSFSNVAHGACFQFNLHYADIYGNIGYWTTGNVPIRNVEKGHTGKIPVEGWKREGDWLGIIPKNELPHGFNPEKGYFVSSNNKIIDDNFPHYLGSIWVNGYRAARIKEYIEDFTKSQRKIKLTDLQKLQVDVKSLAAIDFVRELSAYHQQVVPLLTQELDKQAWNRLMNFDGFMFTNSSEATIYRVLRMFLSRNIFEPVLGENATSVLLGKSVLPGLKEISEFYNYESVVLHRLLKNGDESKWMKKVGVPIHQIIAESVSSSVAWLSREMESSDISQWKYGIIHQVAFDHVLGKLPPLNHIFSVGPYPIGGDSETVMLSPISPIQPYNLKFWSTYYRQCIDLGNLKGAGSIHVPGQSGNLGSKHYDDLIDIWRNGEYHPMLWDEQSILQLTERKLVLKP
eukprot:TRINITY_DN1706_c0_g1_i2.p1 TRINITY_DN1706_c0_g1~~TRINITY_DN1706_c0_g1_i2.p1  ORF type:complete len:637 (-),score=142.10 TRINITY_DN1706_c0_g1_i2:49-1959(-)